MRAKILCCAIIALLLQQWGYAQKAKDFREYKERATAVRQEVWAWDIPAFKNPPAVTDNKSSAVVIAKHVDVKTSSTKKLKYIGVGFKIKKDIFYSNTVREMVKLNDKAALDEYSEFSFKKLQSLNTYFHRGLTTTIVGVRVIKPDGSQKEVNVDEEIVNEEDDKKQQKSKLAIPDLQVGDIIDYFVRVEEQKDVNSPIDQQVFILGDDKPVMQYSVHCEISDKYFVRYRASNGAPDLKIKRDDDGNVMDLLVRNLPSLPVDLWMSPYRQIPMIRMDILFGTRLEAGQSAGEVRRNPSQQEIKESILKDIITDGWNLWAAGGGHWNKDIHDMMKQYKRERGKEIPDDSLAYYVYYAFRFLAFYKVNFTDKIMVGTERNYIQPDNKKFIFFLQDAMRRMDVPVEFVLVTSRYGPGQEEVLNNGDYEYMLKTQGPKPIFMSADGVFSNCAYIAPEYEKQVAPVIDLKKYDKRRHELKTYDEIKVGTSTADDNKQIEQLKISLDDDMQLLKVNRQTTLKGSLRVGEQRRLLLFQDYYESERKALGLRNSFMEELDDNKAERKLAEEYANAFAEAKKAQKDQFMEEVQEQFDVKPTELVSFKINQQGLRHDKPDFVYATSFTLDGLVKKAGNNYILDAGKLIGEPLKVKTEQRDRKVDVYMPFARSFEYDIEITIPSDYTLVGADKLNKEIDNESGSFTVQATVAPDKLKLHIRKAYKNNFEPVAKWNNLLQIIDAATDFYNQKVLLKKS
ncbi:DUF3857 domain-containing protein [Chitinophaga sp. 30R24]|uniref:DUF3857 domain-containing protein n=1 Tax=Chitinophaga sp. 30R24 TaxID=3248838 RepID=UPI003B8F3DD2